MACEPFALQHQILVTIVNHHDQGYLHIKMLKTRSAHQLDLKPGKKKVDVGLNVTDWNQECSKC